MKPEIKKIVYKSLVLNEELEDYLEELEENGKSQRTILNYKGWIEDFFTYLSESQEEDQITIDKIKLSTVRYQKSLMAKGQKNSTINLKTIGLNSFYKFLALLEKDRRGRDIPLKVELLEVNKKHSIEDNKLLETDDYMKLLEVAKSNNDTRALALFLFLYDTGARISEALGVDIEDIEDLGGAYKVPIRGKRNKERDLEFDEAVYTAIKIYLTATGRTIKTKGPLFITERKIHGEYKRLSSRSADLTVKKYGKETGLPVTKFFSHNFRKLMARTMLDGGNTLDKVKSFLGHSNISTTALYTMDKASTLREGKAQAKRQAKYSYLTTKYGADKLEIIEILFNNPGISNNKLAEQLGVSKATFSRRYGKSGMIEKLRKELES